ncbi:MAG TPA: hypothetical protein VJ963_08750 [Bacteroidales bacterium]|nr:hypothetical protein [Bacteroidales bacterium]
MHYFKLTLLIASFTIPLFLSFTLFATSGDNLPKKIMGFGLLNAFFVFLANFIYFLRAFSIYLWIHSLHIATVLWIFPSIYLYVRSIVSGKGNLKKEFVHFIPGVLFGLTSALLFGVLLSHDQKLYYLSNYRSGIQFENINLRMVYAFRSADVLMIVAQVIYYSVSFIRIPYRYHRELKEEYSNIEHFSLSWLKWFNFSFVTVGLLSVAFYFFNPFHEGNDFFLVFFLFIISVFTWVLGLWSFSQRKPGITEETNDGTVTKNHVFGKVQDNELANRLIRYFEDKKPFLKPDLTLTMVCKDIGTNRTYLSSVINSNFGVNFNTFVNQFRAKYVEEYLKHYPQTTKEELTQIGGFGSVSSLKRVLNKDKRARILSEVEV